MAKIPIVSAQSRHFRHISRKELVKYRVHPMVVGYDDRLHTSLAVSIIPPQTSKKYGGKGRVCGSIQRAVHSYLREAIFCDGDDGPIYYRACIGFYFGEGKRDDESYGDFVRRAVNGVTLPLPASYYKLSKKIPPKESHTDGLGDYDLFTTDGTATHVARSGGGKKASRRPELYTDEPEFNRYELEATKIEKEVEIDREQSKRRWDNLLRTVAMLRRKVTAEETDGSIEA